MLEGDIVIYLIGFPHFIGVFFFFCIEFICVLLHAELLKYSNMICGKKILVDYSYGLMNDIKMFSRDGNICVLQCDVQNACYVEAMHRCRV